MSCNDAFLNTITINDFKEYFPSIEYNPYSQWDALIPYSNNQYIYYNFKVYKSLQNTNLGNNPATTPSFWQYQSDIDMSIYMFDSYITNAFEVACASLAWFLIDLNEAIKKEAYLYLTAHYAELRRMSTLKIQNISYGLEASKSISNVSVSRNIPTWLTDKEYYSFMQTPYGAKYMNMLILYRKPFIATFSGRTNF